MTAIEDAQVRVAKAQEAKDDLQEEIHKKYGSQGDLDMHCKSDHYSKKGGPRDLRRRYGAVTKELRLAKSDLARMRNEENQKVKEWPVEVEGTENGIALKNVPEEALEALGDHGTGRVVGPTLDGQGMVIELDPLRPAYMEPIDKAVEKTEASKKPVQMDLEGKKAKAPLSGRIKVPPERFELETPSWVLKGPKEAMLELVRAGQRTAVKAKVQKGLRAKKDAIINDGDFDLAVERFTDEIMRGIIHRLPEDE